MKKKSSPERVQMKFPTINPPSHKETYVETYLYLLGSLHKSQLPDLPRKSLFATEREEKKEEKKDSNKRYTYAGLIKRSPIIVDAVNPVG